MGKIEDNKDFIIHAYTELYWSMGMIADKLGVSRQGVALALQSWGIPTPKSVRVELTCNYCGAVREVERSLARRKKELNEPYYCNRECYCKFMRREFS